MILHVDSQASDIVAIEKAVRRSISGASRSGPMSTLDPAKVPGESPAGEWGPSTVES